MWTSCFVSVQILVSLLLMLVKNVLSYCLRVFPGRIPVRLYVWTVNEDFYDLEDAPKIDSWDKISFINRPVEIHSEEGMPCPFLI